MWYFTIRINKIEINKLNIILRKWKIKERKTINR